MVWNQLRPVSLTDHFAKVAESFIIDWLKEDIEMQIDDGQFGNRKGRSTTHYLVKLVDEILKHTDQAKSLSRIIITDFSKRVDHNIAIPKLLNMGTRPAPLPWICDFLTDRIQCVRYRDISSDWGKLSGGVPQGTLDGPTIFLALANDAAIMKDSNKMALKYVDDLTLVENISVSQQSTIQCDLDSFDQWATENHMNLNPAKCIFMVITFVKEPPALPPLRLCGQDLQSTEVVKILGIKITNDLRWDVHISDVTRRASGRLFMLSMLKRHGLCVKDLVTVYVGFIHPLLEYAVPVRHPGLTEKQHYALERIQRRACRIMLGYTYSHYKEALITCNIPELKLRRDKICLDFAKKLYTSTEFRKWLPKLRSEATGRTLRNAQKMTTQNSRTNRYLQSPISFMTRLCSNALK